MRQRAKESRQVEKAREKLRKKIEAEHQKFSSKALQEIAIRLRTSISRHHPEMKNLKQRKFTLFDENTHTAETKSRQVLKLQKMLQQGVIKMD